jgi:hypothetical protein
MGKIQALIEKWSPFALVALGAVGLGNLAGQNLGQLVDWPLVAKHGVSVPDTISGGLEIWAYASAIIMVIVGFSLLAKQYAKKTGAEHGSR